MLIGVMWLLPELLASLIRTRLSLPPSKPPRTLIEHLLPLSPDWFLCCRLGLVISHHSIDSTGSVGDHVALVEAFSSDAHLA